MSAGHLRWHWSRLRKPHSEIPALVRFLFWPARLQSETVDSGSLPSQREDDLETSSSCWADSYSLRLGPSSIPVVSFRVARKCVLIASQSVVDARYEAIRSSQVRAKTMVVLAKVDAGREMGGFGGLLSLVRIDSGPARDSIRYQVNSL